jgi:hypothetical protein
MAALPPGFAGAPRRFGDCAMGDREALARFHDWRTARNRGDTTRFRWCSRRTRRMAAPVSLGVGRLLTSGSHLRTRRRLLGAEFRRAGRSLTE